jgi:TPR repeat protein
MTEEQKNTPDEPTSGEHSATEVAKEAVSKAKEMANQGLNATRQKFEEAGGVEGLKSKGKGFMEQVKAGFVPDEGTTGFKGFMSRAKNLWKSGLPGKVTMACLALLLLFAINGGNDDKKAQRLWKKAEAHIEAKEFDKALKYVSKAAKLGHMDAITTLMAGHGMGLLGLEKDLDKSVYWLKKLIDKGDPTSMDSYGLMLYQGTDIDKDEELATAMWEKAANLGHSGSAGRLASISYGQGIGTAKDLEQAAMWAYVAKDLNNPLANRLVAAMENECSVDQLKSGRAAADNKMKQINKVLYARKKKGDQKDPFKELGLSFSTEKSMAVEVLKSQYLGTGAVIPGSDDIVVVNSESSVIARVTFDSNGNIKTIMCSPIALGFSSAENAKAALKKKYDMKPCEDGLENDHMQVAFTHSAVAFAKK